MLPLSEQQLHPGLDNWHPKTNSALNPTEAEYCFTKVVVENTGSYFPEPSAA